METTAAAASAALDPLHEFVEWKRDHPDRGVPENARTDSGFALGRWVQRMRDAYKDGRLSSARITELDRAGFTWDGETDRVRGRELRSNRRFSEMVSELRMYRSEFGDVVVPRSYVAPSGNNLGAWVYRTQRAWRSGDLSASRIRRLHALGLRPTRTDTYNAAISSMVLRKIS